MSVWPSDVDYAIVTGRLARVTADDGDADTIPDFRAATGRVVLEPDLREVRYVGEMGPIMLSLETVACTIDETGNVLGPDGESIVTILASDSRNLEQTGWTWTVRFELDDGTWREASHVLAKAGERVDLARLAKVSASAGVEDVADTVTIDRANAAADRAEAATATATDAATKATEAAASATDAAERATSATGAATSATGDATTAAKAATDAAAAAGSAAAKATTAAENCDATASGADATATAHGLMSAADKAKLDGVQANAAAAPNPNLLRETATFGQLSDRSNLRQRPDGLMCEERTLTWRGAHMPVTLEKGETYTLSFDVVTNGFAEGQAGGARPTLRHYDGDTDHIVQDAQQMPYARDGRASFTFVAQDARYLIYPEGRVDAGSVELSRFKVERGAVATPWVPHVDDLGGDAPAPATHDADGLMSAADKAKLDGLSQQEPLAYDARPTRGSSSLVTSGSVADALSALPLDVRGMHVHRFGYNIGTCDNTGATYPSFTQEVNGCYIEELTLLAIMVLDVNGNLMTTSGAHEDGRLVLPSYVPRPVGSTHIANVLIWTDSNPMKTWSLLVYQPDGTLRTTGDGGSGGGKVSLFSPCVVPLRAVCADDTYIDGAQSRGRQLIGSSMAGEVLG